MHASSNSQIHIARVLKRPCFLSDPWLRRSGPSKIDSSKWVVSSPHCINESFVVECYVCRIIGSSHHGLCSVNTAAVLLTCWGGVHQFFTMDTILRLLEGLRRDELVWLNTYLTGRLRALPPPATATTPVQSPSTPPCTNAANDPGGELPARHWLSELAILTCLWTRGSPYPMAQAVSVHGQVCPENQPPTSLKNNCKSSRPPDITVFQYASILLKEREKKENQAIKGQEPRQGSRSGKRLAKKGSHASKGKEAANTGLRLLLQKAIDTPVQSQNQEHDELA